MRYGTHVKEDIVRRLQAGLSPEEISDQLSIPESTVRRFSKELEVAQNKSIMQLGRDIREVEALSEEKQDEYIRQVVRTTALKAAVALEALPGSAIVANAKTVTGLARWIDSVATPKDKADSAKPVLNFDALLNARDAQPEDGDS